MLEVLWYAVKYFVLYPAFVVGALVLVVGTLWYLFIGGVSTGGVFTRYTWVQSLIHATGLLLGNNNRRAILFLLLIPYSWAVCFMQPGGRPLIEQSTPGMYGRFMQWGPASGIREGLDIVVYGQKDHLGRATERGKERATRLNEITTKEKQALAERSTWGIWLGKVLVTLIFDLFFVVMVVISPREEVLAGIRAWAERRRGATPIARPAAPGAAAAPGGPQIFRPDFQTSLANWLLVILELVEPIRERMRR